MEENKTLFLVLPDNWHFVRGDIKGFQVKIFIVVVVVVVVHSYVGGVAQGVTSSI